MTEDARVLARTIAAHFFTHDRQRQDNLSTQIFAALTAYGAACAAEEREKIKEVVYTQANALLAQIEASAIDATFRSGYKRGVNTALDAIRADQPGA